MITPMENLARLQIGTIDFVSPDEIKVVLDLDAPQSVAMNYGQPRPFPRINGFVLIPTESCYIVGQVTWLAVEHAPYPKRKGMQDFGLIDLPFPLRKMSISLLGSLYNTGQRDEVSYNFYRGVHAFPGLGDPVIIPDPQQLRSIIESGTNGNVLIGHCPLADNAEVRINPDRLFGRHLAVLGNTGSGKSCSVAGLIHWSLDEAKRQTSGVSPNARFIVLDPNGEYSHSFEKHRARVFKVEPSEEENELLLNIPAWLWNSNEWSAFTQASGRAQRPLLRRALREVRNDKRFNGESDFKIKVRRYISSSVVTLKSDLREQVEKNEPTKFGGKLSTIADDLNSYADMPTDFSDAVRALSTKIQAVTGAYHAQFTKDGEIIHYYRSFPQEPVSSLIVEAEELLSVLGGVVVDSGFGEDTPARFNPLILADHIEHIAQSENSPQFFDFLIMRIRTLLSDTRMVSISGDVQGISLMEWLESYIGSNDATNGTVSVIDLSLVPQEIVHIVTAVISRLTFESLQRYRRSHPENKVLPTTLVMEEAHNFVNRYRSDYEEESASSMCCKVFEKIAREGRKFGLGLVLSSQRPSELSPTVLSQCNTFLLHRITNDKDQEMVSRLLPDGLRGLIREVPALPSQHAFLVGWAAELPILTEMLSLSKRERPASDDPDFWNVWTRKNPNGEYEVREVNWKVIANEWQQEQNRKLNQEKGQNDDHDGEEVDF